MDGLLEILTQFSGGADEASGAAIRYLLPAFFWLALAVVSIAHWRTAREDRDRLVGIAAIVGMGSELLLFLSCFGSARGWPAAASLHGIALPLEHAASLSASLLVAYAFLRCVLRWNPLPRNILSPLAGLLAILYLWEWSAWTEHLLAAPDASFERFRGHLLLHLAGTFFLGGLLAVAQAELLWGRRRVPFALLAGLLFLMLSEGTLVADQLSAGKFAAVYGAVSQNLHLWAIPLFVAVYWQELRLRVEESEKTRSSLFELSPGMLCVADDGGRIMVANPASLRILGISPGRLQGRPITDFCRPEKAEGFDLEAIRGADVSVQVEAPYRFPGESADRWLQWTFRFEETARRFFVLATDATALKRAHDTLIRSEEMLRHSSKIEAVGRLAGGIAHDFNNLLTAILGYCELAVSYAGDPARVRKDVEEIRRAAERAAGLTRQLLAFSRRQQLSPRPIDLNETIVAMDGMLRRLIGEDIELVTEPAPGLWKVKADPGQIEQVVVNLVVNARDSIAAGGRIVLSTRNIPPGTEGGPAAGEPLVALEVKDDGSGMDEETKARLFEPFFTTKAKGKGTGLGLSTVHGIVRQSGGDIRVESSPGAGATFTVTLPVAKAEDVRKAASPPGAAPPAGRGGERILLVEDEEAVRDMVRESLGIHGFRVREACDGREALAIYEASPGAFDMVLTDVVMPGMSGGELAAALRQRDPAVKVLFMSGYSADTLVSHGVSRHGMAFLEKPFTQEALRRKVRAVLDSGGPAPSAGGEQGERLDVSRLGEEVEQGDGRHRIP